MKNLREFGFSDYIADSIGKIYSLKSNRYLSGWIGTGGYPCVVLTDDEGKLHQLKVHRVLAFAYLKNDDPDNKDQVNHIDGDKENNNISNLEWCTPQENSQHAVDMKLKPPVYYHEDIKLPDESDLIHDWREPKSYLDVTEDDVHIICQHLQDGYRVCDVSSMLAVDRRFVQALRDNEKRPWFHITSLYDFSKLRRKRQMSPEKVRKVCEYLQNTDRSMNSIAEELNIDRKTVSGIKNRKFHLKISSEYEW